MSASSSFCQLTAQNSRVMAIRLLFLSVLIFFVLQYLFMYRFGEPYPALVMPGFSGSGGYVDGHIRIKRPEVVFVFDDESTAIFSQRQLLSKIPDGHHGMIFASFFQLPKDEQLHDNSPPKYGINRRTIFPGWQAGKANRMAAPNRESIRLWLKNRGAELMPGKHIKHVDIRWYEEIYRMGEAKFASSRQLLGTWTIPIRDIPYAGEKVAR
jgi:hypothetical protein